MKYRLGRKQNRVILNETGHEVVIFHKGNEKLAERVCKFMNNEFDKLNLKVDVPQFCSPPNITNCRSAIDPHYDCVDCDWEIHVENKII